MSLGRWLLVACFSSLKNHIVSDLIGTCEFDGKKPLFVERTIAILINLKFTAL